ncbi:hypothetical protein QBC37DRAFT_376219 [Rhypophila decipiens]|uniref:Uncharacterized protein n=1 Tax=Rhypophila decipiens TaxID=261697 RepID=A0AAN6Y2H8_9PEZI|nr:hypothetical protein QBC37DRAFT_376219 [Rhypophila decipiens]
MKLLGGAQQQQQQQQHHILINSSSSFLPLGAACRLLAAHGIILLKFLYIDL